MTRPRIGLALGSGSARGWSHVGVIERLVEAGIEPDVICGTSVGALVGAAYLTGRLDKLHEWGETVTWRQILGLMDVSLSGGGLIRGKTVVKFLRDLGITGPIEKLAKPFAAVATELSTGREIWFQSGPVLEAVHASIAVPGIFSPVHHGGQWLLDGGLVNPVPVSVCRALGADVIIAVNLNGDQLGRWKKSQPVAATHPPEHAQPESFAAMLTQLPSALGDQLMQIGPRLLAQSGAPGYFDVLSASIDIMQDHITRARLAGEPPHVMLVPRLRGVGLMDYDRAVEAIAEGRATAEDALPAIRRFL